MRNRIKTEFEINIILGLIKYVGLTQSSVMKTMQCENSDKNEEGDYNFRELEKQVNKCDKN